MAETDAKDRDPASQLANILLRIGDRFRIPGAVREEYAIRLERKNIASGSACGNYGNLAMMIDEQAKDVLLDAEIVGDDFELSDIVAGAGFAHLLGPG